MVVPVAWSKYHKNLNAELWPWKIYTEIVVESSLIYIRLKGIKT